MKPALTAEEWAKRCVHDSTDKTISADTTETDCLWLHDEERMTGIAIDRLHALAALCLHNQPFGFTREDVEMLRKIAEWTPGYSWSDVDSKYSVQSLANRIEALLPPEADSNE